MILLSLPWILVSLLFSYHVNVKKNNVWIHFYIMSHKKENMSQNVLCVMISKIDTKKQSNCKISKFFQAYI